MLVRKFLRCKLTDEAKEIVNLLDLKHDGDIILPLTLEQRDLIVQSLYKTERTWEME